MHLGRPSTPQFDHGVPVHREVDADLPGRRAGPPLAERAAAAHRTCVAATAEVLGRPLATRNVTHFPMFPELRPAY